MRHLQAWTLGRRPELDGLRALAVTLVVICHAGVPGLQASGQVGVTVFFTLSGFLITTLLLDERANSGRIRLIDFFRRRALRLLPALIVMILLVGGLMVAVGDPLTGVASDAAAALLYYANWVRMSDHLLANWSHTWSLAIEEQFYLVWPFVVVALGRRREKLLFWVALAVSAYAVTARAILWDDGGGLLRVYYGTDTHADALLVGAALAIYMRQRPPSPSRPVVVAVLMAGIAAWALSGSGSPNFVLGATAVPLLTCLVIHFSVRGGGVKWLSSKPLVYVGRRSYGLYLWHYPILAMGLSRLPGPVWIKAIVLISVSWLVTLMSWRFIERPFLALKRNVADGGSTHSLDRPRSVDLPSR